MFALRRHRGALALVAGVAALVATLGVAPARAGTGSARQPRVLMIGDSVMDQEGGAAEFLLKQAGVDALHVGIWGSGLLTVDQYDNGKTDVDHNWMKKAADLVASFDPDVVAVYMNHNYWQPWPHDAAGHVIASLASPSGQLMIGQQATALVKILRARGARVYFVAPLPGDGPTIATNDIWRGYMTVLPHLHVGIINSAVAVAGPGGLRVEDEPDCTGTPTPVRPPGDIHLTRFGAALVGTALAQSLANTVHVSLNDNAAPGDHTAALVANPAGPGYWIVGCDGSIYDFGGAPPLRGVRAAVGGRHGVTAAIATGTGLGMWLVTADGTIAATGDAKRLAFARRPSRPIITDAAGTADHAGIWAVGGDGSIYTAGTARDYGSMAGKHLNGFTTGIAATADGKGYTLVGIDGGIFGFGDASFFGSMGSSHLNQPVTNLARTPDGRGYWLVAFDGGIFGFGDARFYGSGLYRAPAYPLDIVHQPPGPTFDAVAAPGTAQGYWTVTDNGRVTNHGAAVGDDGTNNLALFTP